MGKKTGGKKMPFPHKNPIKERLCRWCPGPVPSPNYFWLIQDSGGNRSCILCRIAQGFAVLQHRWEQRGRRRLASTPGEVKATSAAQQQDHSLLLWVQPSYHQPDEMRDSRFTIGTLLSSQIRADSHSARVMLALMAGWDSQPYCQTIWGEVGLRLSLWCTIIWAEACQQLLEDVDGVAINCSLDLTREMIL